MRYKETIGSAPYGEMCAQVGEENYSEKARSEIARFCAGMKILFPPPEGAAFVTVSENHDFGRYFELGCSFNDSDEHMAWFERVDSGIPETWDELDRRVAEHLLQKT